MAMPAAGASILLSKTSYHKTGKLTCKNKRKDYLCDAMMKNFINRPIPLYVFILFIVAVLPVFFLLFPQATPASDLPVNQDMQSSCKVSLQRLGGFTFIKPLVYAEQETESVDYRSVKQDLQNLIDSKKSQGLLRNGAVYFREFSGGQWFGIQEKAPFSPGSLLKVPELIAFYKMKEKEPGLFDKKFLFDKEQVVDRRLHFLSKRLEVGKTYTVRDFLEYMIVHSDNQATMILNALVNRDVFVKVFTDIGLPSPDFNARDYPISAKDYSRFFIELYNGSYLTFKDSEASMTLLSQVVFKEGMIKGIPASVPVCHKFGESGSDAEPHFSESGIVFVENKPYLLTVMLSGHDVQKLPAISAEISDLVYRFVAQP